MALHSRGLCHRGSIRIWRLCAEGSLPWQARVSGVHLESRRDASHRNRCCAGGLEEKCQVCSQSMHLRLESSFCNAMSGPVVHSRRCSIHAIPKRRGPQRSRTIMGPALRRFTTRLILLAFLIAAVVVPSICLRASGVLWLRCPFLGAVHRKMSKAMRMVMVVLDAHLFSARVAPVSNPMPVRSEGVAHCDRVFCFDPISTCHVLELFTSRLDAL